MPVSSGRASPRQGMTLRDDRYPSVNLRGSTTSGDHIRMPMRSSCQLVSNCNNTSNQRPAENAPRPQINPTSGFANLFNPPRLTAACGSRQSAQNVTRDVVPVLGNEAALPTGAIVECLTVMKDLAQSMLKKDRDRAPIRSEVPKKTETIPF